MYLIIPRHAGQNLAGLANYLQAYHNVCLFVKVIAKPAILILNRSSFAEGLLTEAKDWKSLSEAEKRPQALDPLSFGFPHLSNQPLHQLYSQPTASQINLQDHIFYSRDQYLSPFSL